jgi:hypothetical protein
MRVARAGALSALIVCSCASDDAAPSESPEVALDALAADAFVWGYPLVVTERTLQSLGGLVGVNKLFNQAAISNSQLRVIVAPNQDTLYSVAVVDLRSGPVVLTVPDAFDRYWTYQFLDAWTESFHYIGTRTTGGRGGTFALTPPGSTALLPAGAAEIPSPTAQLFLLGRYHVRSPEDVPNIVALERTLAPLSAEAPPSLGQAPGAPQAVGSDGAAFFDELGDVLAINAPASDHDRDELARSRVLGIGAAAHPTETANADTLAALEAGAAAGLNRILGTALSEPVNGWSTNTNIGRYGDDTLTRAVVARGGWGANVPEEAVYAFSRQDANGDPYDGTQRYIMHFEPGQTPPLEDALGFWSVTVYGTDMFFVANALERHAIGDRSPGLSYNGDGSLDLYLQVDAPPGLEANWLPIPAALFVLVLRVYLPSSAVQNGDYVIPAVSVAP